MTVHQTLHYTQHQSHHLTHHSKPVIHNILIKGPLSDTEKASGKRVWKDVVAFNFPDEIDDSQLLTAELN